MSKININNIIFLIFVVNYFHVINHIICHRDIGNSKNFLLSNNFFYCDIGDSKNLLLSNSFFYDDRR